MERCKVERVNAWMDTYRALVVRYERTAAHYLSYCQLSAVFMCLRRLISAKCNLTLHWNGYHEMSGVLSGQRPSHDP